MYWELRSAPHTDLLGYSDDLDDVLSLARECIEGGFPLQELYVCAEWREGEQGDDADLPPVLSGPELASRAQAAHAKRTPRSA